MYSLPDSTELSSGPAVLAWRTTGSGWRRAGRRGAGGGVARVEGAGGGGAEARGKARGKGALPAEVGRPRTEREQARHDGEERVRARVAGDVQGCADQDDRGRRGRKPDAESKYRPF